MWTHDQVRAHSAHVKARAASSSYIAPEYSSDGFAEYLRMIGRIGLLATRRERELGDRVQAGLARGVEDTAAVEQLVEHNLRLVVAVAKFYANRGVELEDLIGEGNIGLWRAARSYNPDKAAFSTHAVWWIRQACSRAVLNLGHAIRRPVHVGEKLNRLKRVAQAWTQEHKGASPSLEQLAEASGYTYELVVALLIVPADPVSLNIPTAEDDDREVGEAIPDPKAQAAYERLERAVDNAEAVEWALDFLTDRQREVLVYRLGLDGGRRRTLEQTGALLRPPVTRERVRQIEAAALKRLRIRFKHEDGALVRRTPDEEKAQERLELRLMKGRKGDVRPGAPSVGKMRKEKRLRNLASLVDSRAAVAS